MQTILVPAQQPAAKPPDASSEAIVACKATGRPYTGDQPSPGYPAPPGYPDARRERAFTATSGTCPYKRANGPIGATSEKANIIIRCGIAAGSNSYATVWVDAAWAALRRLYQITATKAPTVITPATMIAKIACWRNAIIGTATAISSATKQSRHDAA